MSHNKHASWPHVNTSTKRSSLNILRLLMLLCTVHRKINDNASYFFEKGNKVLGTVSARHFIIEGTVHNVRCDRKQ